MGGWSGLCICQVSYLTLVYGSSKNLLNLSFGGDNFEHLGWTKNDFKIVININHTNASAIAKMKR